MTKALSRACALASALLLGTAPLHAQDAQRTGAAAWQALVGNTVVATTKNGGYTEFYAADGAVRRQDADGATTGQWVQNGDTVCLDYPDDDDHVCLHVAVQGSAGSFTDPDGTVDRFDILSGNAKNL